MTPSERAEGLSMNHRINTRARDAIAAQIQEAVLEERERIAMLIQICDLANEEVLIEIAAEIRRGTWE